LLDDAKSGRDRCVQKVLCEDQDVVIPGQSHAGEQILFKLADAKPCPTAPFIHLHARQRKVWERKALDLFEELFRP